MKSCQEECLNNCSCKAALFLQKDAFLQGSCFLPSPVLSLSRDWISFTPQAYKSYAFIKVSNHGKIGRVSRPQIIAGSTIGTIVIVGLVVGLWIVLSRKKNNGVEGTEDFLDQLQGMPTRFTYEELKAATKDFHTKLGKGGFGSVFEGNLETGEKIAVKRLEGLGQGKKEFLAEKRAQEDQLIDMVDNSSEDMQLHRLEAAEMMRVAIWCLQSDHTRRPSMSTVVKVLEGTMGVEADLDYCLHNATTMAAIRREAVLGSTTTLLPSLLSGPR
ncbi:hypothetical protein NC652_010707 [Populus alba x Populus x berolinensis]|nr:hypothetical protein NC652_010707 [Populus alba x Populus x berolinensis]